MFLWLEPFVKKYWNTFSISCYATTCHIMTLLMVKELPLVSEASDRISILFKGKGLVCSADALHYISCLPVPSLIL